MNSEKGVTLPEMMISAVILISLLLVFGTVFQKGNNLSDVFTAESKIQRNSRKIINTIASNLRQARLAQISIPNAPNNNQISFDLPIYQQGVSSCSAFASVSDGTSPVICGSDANCVTFCGGDVSNTFCSNQICRRTYTYSVNAVTSNLSQVVVSGATEPNRTVGSHVGTLVFQDNGMDPNLRSDELKITLMTTSDIVSEKRVRNLSVSSVVQIKN